MMTGCRSNEDHPLNASAQMDNKLRKGEGAAINGWVYLLGEVTGVDVKVGGSTGETMRKRLTQVDRDQMGDGPYVLLAAVRGDRKDEEAVKRYFSSLRRTDKGSRREYFHPSAEIAEYANWLRECWWTSIDIDDLMDEVEAVDPDMWLPRPERRRPAPESDEGLLIPRHVSLDGPLAGTAWDWMVSPRQSIQDYFTPTEIIAAARVAMGDIDLDAASHPLANREHRIPDYFHINRSAFENDWYGRVWLNPPYGNNAPWFECIERYLDVGTVTQLCMLSPVWAFTTEQAKPIMRRSSATVLLSPTPKFWGNAENRTGSNQPHAVVYFGDRVAEFVQAFAPHGIPMSLETEVAA